MKKIAFGFLFICVMFLSVVTLAGNKTTAVEEPEQSTERLAKGDLDLDDNDGGPDEGIYLLTVIKG